MITRNETIHAHPVRADWHRMTTPALVALAHKLERGGCYNRDTILELVGTLASRIEELRRVVETYKEAA